MIDSYAKEERIAICIESGVPYSLALKIANSELPKKEYSAAKQSNRGRY